MSSEEETPSPFSMSFRVDLAECQVCGKSGGCDHLDPPVNRNGDYYAPGVLAGAMKEFIGKPVTIDLKHEIADKLAQHMAELPPDLIVKDVRVEGDRLITEIGTREEVK